MLILEIDLFEYKIIDGLYYYANKKNVFYFYNDLINSNPLPFFIVIKSKKLFSNYSAKY